MKKVTYTCIGLNILSSFTWFFLVANKFLNKMRHKITCTTNKYVHLVQFINTFCKKKKKVWKYDSWIFHVESPSEFRVKYVIFLNFNTLTTNVVSVHKQVYIIKDIVTKDNIVKIIYFVCCRIQRKILFFFFLLFPTVKEDKRN